MDQLQLARIRLLSARFSELQGLRVTLAGSSITVAVGGYLAAAPTPTNNGALVAFLLSWVPVFALMPYVSRYYQTRFGRQRWTASRKMWLFFGAYVVLAFALNAAIPEIPAGTPTLATVALVSIAVAIRDWPWRAYYLGVTAAMASGFALTASGAGLLPAHLTLVTLLLVLGVSMVSVGILDHLLLVRLMRDARAPLAGTTAAR
jgi:hypothetical protein